MKENMTDQELVRALAHELAKERIRLGISQQEIYDETGIHVGRIECMEVAIQVTTLYNVCSYLGISCSEIFNRLVEPTEQV